MRKGLFCSALLLGLVACHPAKTKAGEQASSAADLEVRRISLPGEGRGDYITVDAEGGRLYVTHSAVVHILDLATLRPLAEVTGLEAANGVALGRKVNP